MIGIDPSAITNGSTTRERNLEYHSDSPMTVPIKFPTRKPSKVSSQVT
jgi:hypothetical protein